MASTPSDRWRRLSSRRVLDPLVLPAVRAVRAVLAPSKSSRAVGRMKLAASEGLMPIVDVVETVRSIGWTDS